MQPVSDHKGKYCNISFKNYYVHTSLKVVKAKWRKGSTFTVDNIRGYLLDAGGLSFLPFGAYSYGVRTDIERAIPEMEAPFGEQLLNI